MYGQIPYSIVLRNIRTSADLVSSILTWISRFENGFLDFRLDFWISEWISGFQIGFPPTVYEISLVTDPSWTPAEFYVNL